MVVVVSYQVIDHELDVDGLEPLCTDRDTRRADTLAWSEIEYLGFVVTRRFVRRSDVDNIFAALRDHSETVKHVLFLRVPPRIKYDFYCLRVGWHWIFAPGVYLVGA